VLFEFKIEDIPTEARVISLGAGFLLNSVRLCFEMTAVFSCLQPNNGKRIPTTKIEVLRN